MFKPGDIVECIEDCTVNSPHRAPSMLDPIYRKLAPTLGTLWQVRGIGFFPYEGEELPFLSLTGQPDETWCNGDCFRKLEDGELAEKFAEVGLHD